MTCQKSKSKLGNRRVRLDPAIPFKNVCSVFDCGNHSHSQIVRGRKINNLLALFVIDERDRYSRVS